MRKKFKDTFWDVGGAILGGLVGQKKPNNHGVPYSLTEEFVSIYRLHSLLPDNLHLREITATPGPNKSPPLIEEYNSLSLSTKLVHTIFMKIACTLDILSQLLLLLYF